VAERFDRLGLFKDAKHGAANHVLVNEYAPGEGIMPHEDGPAYSPIVATVSLGGTVVLDLYAKKEDAGEAEMQEESGSREKPTWRILQESGSLLVTTGEAYVTLLHGISPVTVDEDLGPQTIANWGLLGEPEHYDGGRNVRETRTSLTYRDVLKVSKVGIGMLGRR
jgi:alkylated DNA repair protein alkB family protein 6